MRYLAKRVERICDELYRLRIVQRMEWTERGPVRATLEIERKVSPLCALVLIIEFIKGDTGEAIDQFTYIL